jgi:hypothetical protein
LDKSVQIALTRSSLREPGFIVKTRKIAARLSGWITDCGNTRALAPPFESEGDMARISAWPLLQRNSYGDESKQPIVDSRSRFLIIWLEPESGRIKIPRAEGSAGKIPAGS